MILTSCVFVATEIRLTSAGGTGWGLTRGGPTEPAVDQVGEAVVDPNQSFNYLPNTLFKSPAFCRKHW
jgi:hypothetical protein